MTSISIGSIGTRTLSLKLMVFMKAPIAEVEAARGSRVSKRARWIAGRKEKLKARMMRR